MNIKVILIGKTDNESLKWLTDDYLKRISRYIKIEWITIDDLKNRKNLSIEEQKNQEAELFLKKIDSSDVVILLDENGKMLSSIELATYLNKKMSSGIKNLIFLVGGPYGFAEKLYSKSVESVSLSKMTFSHQLVRVIFTEQLYRAFTIINNEPYHHS